MFSGVLEYWSAGVLEKNPARLSSFPLLQCSITPLLQRCTSLRIQMADQIFITVCCRIQHVALLQLLQLMQKKHQSNAD